jgi:CDP-diacylglycerol pyrophosphatase
MIAITMSNSIRVNPLVVVRRRARLRQKSDDLQFMEFPKPRKTGRLSPAISKDATPTDANGKWIARKAATSH